MHGSENVSVHRCVGWYVGKLYGLGCVCVCVCMCVCKPGMHMGALHTAQECIGIHWLGMGE